MNFRRGFFRLWIIAAAIWIFMAYTLWPPKVPLERQWPPDVSFCRDAPTTFAVCEQRYKELVLEDWERFAIQVSKIIVPPFALFFLGLWVLRGFHGSDYDKAR
jgi:hypothetical protein